MPSTYAEQSSVCFDQLKKSARDVTVYRHRLPNGKVYSASVVEFSRKKWRTAERVNDFATPGFMNLLCRAVVMLGLRSPMVVG